MRFLLAIWVCKAAIVAGKILGKKGSSTPGSLALRICPTVLKRLSAQVRQKTVAVCGTNGKTTTNNMIYSILRAKGHKVVCNNVGANMLPGVATAYIAACGIFGKLDADFAAIEMDEASAVKIFDHVSPDFMVVCNLFRDQLDRYGEVDVTADLLRRAIAKTSENAVLILNADDPICAAFGELGCESTYFGITNPADVTAANIVETDTLQFTINGVPVTLKTRGVYNVYNVLAAFSAAKLLRTDTPDLNSVLAEYKPQIGRMEEFDINGTPVILNLSKNPTGFNLTIETMLADPRKKSVVVIINDGASDGIDVSWLWDVDFERLRDENFVQFTSCGTRAEDVALRLKYAELPNVTLEKNIKAALESAVQSSSNPIYILSNYTPLFEAQNTLKELGGGR